MYDSHMMSKTLNKIIEICHFRRLLELTNFHEDFREALPYWLKRVFSTTQDRVVRAVKVDQVKCYHAA